MLWLVCWKKRTTQSTPCRVGNAQCFAPSLFFAQECRVSSFSSSSCLFLITVSCLMWRKWWRRRRKIVKFFSCPSWAAPHDRRWPSQKRKYTYRIQSKNLCVLKHFKVTCHWIWLHFDTLLPVRPKKNNPKGGASNRSTMPQCLVTFQKQRFLDCLLSMSCIFSLTLTFFRLRAGNSFIML